MRKETALAAGTFLLLVSCAGSYRPTVDMRGVDQAQFEQDLEECRSYAESVSPAREAAVSGGLTAALGAAIGAIAGAFGGGAGEGAAMGAAIGGVSGTAAGGAGGVSDQKAVIRRCLAGRGYSVLR
jgi:hypothetical protein